MAKALGLLVLLSTALLAGCLADEGAPVPQGVPTADDPRLPPEVAVVPAEVMPGELPVAASATYHEVIAPGAFDSPFMTGDDQLPPRDFTLQFNGIQEVHDEFGRPVLAYTFRYPERVYIIDSFEFVGSEVRIDGHFEEHLFESHFDRADGRAIGFIDLDALERHFAGPMSFAPLGPLPSPLMLLQSMGLDPTREVRVAHFTSPDEVERDLFLSYRPFDAYNPLGGDCRVWEMVARFEPEFPEPLVQTPSTEEDVVGLTCLKEGELMPLWHWAGTSTEEYYRLERTSASFFLPPFTGERLAAVPYQTWPWQAVEPTLPVGAVGDTLAPPKGHSGDWAARLHDRVAALYLVPSYLQYRLTSETPYVSYAETGLPPSTNLLPGVPFPPDGIGWDEEALFFLSDGQDGFIGTVYSRVGTAEEPDLHVGSPFGFATTAFFGEGLAATDLPLLPTAADLGSQLSTLVGEQPQRVTFFVTNFIGLYAAWDLLQPCVGETPGWQAGVDALLGYVQWVRVFEPDRFPCENTDLEGESTALARSRLPGWRFPGMTDAFETAGIGLLTPPEGHGQRPRMSPAQPV